MQSGEIVVFFKVPKQILLVSRGYAKRLKLARSTVKFFLISKVPASLACRWLTVRSRRDGSPFMNLLMVAPLCDSRGKIRYHIGAQVDVSGLVKDCTDLESLQRLVVRQQQQFSCDEPVSGAQGTGDEFQELSEMLNIGELDTVRKWGGRMHREYQDDEDETSRSGPAHHMPRLLLKEPNVSENRSFKIDTRGSGRLSGIYQNVGFFSSCSSCQWILADKRQVSADSALPVFEDSFCFAHFTCTRDFAVVFYE